MFRIRPTLLIAVLVWSHLPQSRLSSQVLPPYIESVTVSPPGTQSIGAVRLDGLWPDTCAPDAVSHSVVGNQVLLEVAQPGLNTGCGDFPTPWSLTEEFTMGAADYTILSSLFSVDPLDRGQRVKLSGPDLIYRSMPTPRAHFHGIGNPHDDAYVTRVFDVSRNGNTVVGRLELKPNAAGFITEEAFVWTPSTGRFQLGFLPGGAPGASTAFGVSADGNVVVGQSTSGSPFGFPKAFRWTLGSGMMSLSDLGEPSQSAAAASSRSGSVIAGTNEYFYPDPTFPGIHHRAFRWTAHGMEDLGSLVPEGQSYGADISFNGRVVVGTSDSPMVDTNPLIRPHSREPFLWTEGSGMRGLGHLPYEPTDVPDAFLDTVANAVSADGRFVAGSSALVWNNGAGNLLKRAFLWNQEDGMIDLGGLPILVCCGEYEAIDVSANGDFVVGNLVFPGGTTDFSVPFLWTESDGMRFLEDVLVNDYRLDGNSGLDGWELRSVAAISDDASTIAGTGINPLGDQEAWRVVVDRIVPAGRTNVDSKVGVASFDRYESDGSFSSVPEPSGVLLAIVGLALMASQRPSRPFSFHRAVR